MAKAAKIKRKKSNPIVSNNPVVIQGLKDTPVDIHLAIENIVFKLKEIFDMTRRDDKIPLIRIINEVMPVIFDAIKNQHDLLKVCTQLTAKEDYTYRHTICVAMVAALMAKWLQFQKNDLFSLTAAALLFDIGKIKIPESILYKSGPLTYEEFGMVKKHTIYGYEMIKNTVGTSHLQALVALQHHEREDGSGYPFGLSSEKIALFSKIVGIADTFHAMSAKNGYSQAIPFFQVIREMQTGAYGKLDSKLVFLFTNKVMLSSIGDEVLLSDGSKGKMIMINDFDPLRPLVQLEDGFLDLGKDFSVQLESYFYHA